MTVVDLHPEDLIDKWSEGCLSDAEEVRLGAHVATCAGCRFELGVRRDFAGISRELPSAVLVKGPFEENGRASSPDLAPKVASRHRGRARRGVWLLALSAALVGSVSLAALVARVAVAPSARPGPAVSAPVTAGGGGARAAIARADSRPAESAIALRDLPIPEPAFEARAEERPEIRVHATNGVAGAKLKVRGAAGLFQTANQARRDGNASRAIAVYRALEAEYPSSEEARLSYATLARLLLDRGDARSALEGFDQYLSKGESALGEEALVGRALALQKLGGGDTEAAAWRDVLRRFPKSVHARLARSRLADLGAP